MTISFRPEQLYNYITPLNKFIDGFFVVCNDSCGWSKVQKLDFNASNDAATE